MAAQLTISFVCSPGRAISAPARLSRSRPILLTITRRPKNIRREKQLRRGLKVSSSATAPLQVDEFKVSYRQSGKGIGVDGAVVGKGWTDAEGQQDERWVAKFRALAVVARDRVEMHRVLANQRSNWSHLFHQTIVIAAVSAATAAAINGAEPGPGLTLLAASLNLICAAFMALVNKEQPSQLAEEQRK